MLLAGASYAQTTPPPAPPAPPAPVAPSVEDQNTPPSADEIKRQVEDARREAAKEAAKARLEANRARRRAMAEARSAYLGIVDPSDVTPEKAASLKLKEGRGVVIGMVDHDSPAGKAGLKEHDVILSLGGRKTDNVQELRRIIRETPPGRAVPITVSREGQQMTFNVRLERRPQYARIEIPKFEMPPMPPMPPDIDIPSFTVLQYSSHDGVMVEDLSPQLANFFGVKEGEGVLVRSVDRGSAGDTAGLKAGDVIVKAGGKTVTCSADWRRALREHKDSIAVGVVRDKREQSLTLKLPDKTSSDASREFDDSMRSFRMEMQKVEPQIEHQMRLAQANIQREMALHQKDFEQMRVELDKAGEQIKRSMQEFSSEQKK